MAPSPGESQPASMQDDPYIRYLDLPPGPRPPNLYQLLGVELFCSQPERIHHCSRKQFRRVKPYEDHPDRATREATQDLMTRIATARVVLTDPAQKQQYDEALAAEMGIDRDEFLRQRVAVPIPDCFLRITAGPNMIGERIELLEGPPITIGRDPHCVIALSSSRLGPLHCQIEHRDDNWLLSQVDDEHPTLINDHYCREFLLADGDALDMGGYRLRFIRLPERDVPGLKPPSLSLIIQRGPSVPAAVMNALPSESILVGHCETALWQLADPLISRHHCRIQPAGEHWELADLRSTNGTFVNGQKVKRSVLDHRDQLTIGRFEVLVRMRD
ncbi:MAG: FHA domain-containing protein [bacterium]|nr:FHA domain-containing protein [bacterium]